MPSKIQIAALILAAALCITISYSIGFESGKVSGLDWCVNKGMQLLTMQGYNISIDSHFIALGLAYYQDRVDKLFNQTLS